MCVCVRNRQGVLKKCVRECIDTYVCAYVLYVHMHVVV